MADENQQNQMMPASAGQGTPDSLEVSKSGRAYTIKKRIRWMAPKKKLLLFVIPILLVIIGTSLYFALAGVDDPAMRMVDSAGQNIDGQTFTCGDTINVFVMTDVDPANNPNQNGEAISVAGADIYFDDNIFESVSIDSSLSDYTIEIDETVDAPNNIAQIVRQAVTPPGLAADNQLLTVLNMRIRPSLLANQTVLRFYDETLGDPPEIDSGFVTELGNVLDVNYDEDGSGGSYTININCAFTCDPPYEACDPSQNCTGTWIGDPTNRCCSLPCEDIIMVPSEVQFCSGTNLSVVPTYDSVDFSWCTTPDSRCNISIPGISSYSEADYVANHAFNFNGLSQGTSYSYTVTCSAAGYDDMILNGSFNTLIQSNLNIREIRATDITANRATVSWVTSSLSDSQVYYWETSNPSMVYSNTQSSLVRAHSVNLVGLDPDTEYGYYVVSATDGTSNCAGTSPTCSRSPSYGFSTNRAETSPDSNVILKVDRDRVCDEWLYCNTAIQVLNTKKNPPKEEDVCFSVGLCSQMDDGGRCISVEHSSGVLTKDHPEEVNEIKNLSGYSKVGLDWGYRCINNGLECSCLPSDESCEDATVCGSGSSQCVKAKIDGYYPYSRMEEVGMPISIANGNFEDGTVKPWVAFNNATIANDTEEKANKAMRVEPVGELSGATTPGLANSIEAGRYIVSFRAKTDDPTTQNVWMEVGPYNNGTYTRFEYYDQETGLSSDTLELTNYWREYVMSVDIGSRIVDPLKLTVVQAQGETSDEHFYIDNISMKAVLQVGDPLNYVARSCRMYPTQNAPACDYYDQNSNKDYKGWKGYCVETDLAYQDRRYTSHPVCLQWWPVDIISGESNVFSGNEVVGYSGRMPLYYCLEASAQYPYIKDAWKDNSRPYYVSRARYGTSWYNNAVCTMYSPAIAGGITAMCSDGSGNDYIYYTDYLVIDDNGTSRDGRIYARSGYVVKARVDNEIFFNIALSPQEIEWFGNKEVSKVKVDLYNYSGGNTRHGFKIFDPEHNAVQDYGYGHNGGDFTVGSGSCGNNRDPDRCAAVQINFDNANNLSSDPENAPYMRFRFTDTEDSDREVGAYITYYLRDACTVITKVVDEYGGSKPWTGRVDQGGWTQNQNDPLYNILGYSYGQDYAPYGGAVVDWPDYDPTTWDDPLYVMPPETQGMQAPYQVRAGSPYGAATSTIGETQCIAGADNLLGIICDSSATCGSGGTDACSGFNYNQPNILADGWQGGQGRLAGLFAKSYGVWEWDYTSGGYVEVTDASANALRAFTSYGWDITNNLRYASLPVVNNLHVGDDDSKDFYITSQGNAMVTFNTNVDANQLPLVRYTVNWGDGSSPSGEVGLRIGDMEHTLIHYYEYSTSCDATNLGYCVFTPRVQIEDNWGRCNDEVDTDSDGFIDANEACDSDAWSYSQNSVVVYEQEFSGGPPLLSVDPLYLDMEWVRGETLRTADTFTVINANSLAEDPANLSWSISNVTGFLTNPSITYEILPVSSGVLTPGESVALELRIRGADVLPNRRYSGTFDVTSAYGTETVTVTLLMLDNLFGCADEGEICHSNGDCCEGATWALTCGGANRCICTYGNCP